MIRYAAAVLIGALAAGTAVAGPPRYVGTGCQSAPLPVQLARETWRLEDCATVLSLVSTWE